MTQPIPSCHACLQAMLWRRPGTPVVHWELYPFSRPLTAARARPATPTATPPASLPSMRSTPFWGRSSASKAARQGFLKGAGHLSHIRKEELVIERQGQVMLKVRVEQGGRLPAGLLQGGRLFRSGGSKPRR